MNKRAEITLNSVGFVVFNPDTLQGFVDKHNLSEDIFEEFQQQPLVGDEAIKTGVVIPVYSIPPLDYQIVYTEGEASTIDQEWIKFTTHKFPLVCRSERVVVSDISVLMEWDYDFYKDLAFSDSKLPYTVFDIHVGNYAVQITGFCETSWSGSGPTNKGYELLFEIVKDLPVIDGSIDSDSTNYVVYGIL